MQAQWLWYYLAIFVIVGLIVLAIVLCAVTKKDKYVSAIHQDKKYKKFKTVDNIQEIIDDLQDPGDQNLYDYLYTKNKQKKKNRLRDYYNRADPTIKNYDNLWKI